jgi:diguanylate cyclase (GGDEF)-like protein
MKGKLSKTAWRAVWAWTALMLIISTPLSIIATNSILTVFAGGIDGAGLAAAIAIPVLIGGPATFVMAMKHQQLRLANAQLHILASTDELTAILNRRAFTSLVASYLAGGPPVQAVLEGAFLVIDADDFKRINDSHGHDWGDEALQRIAASIQANVRENDLVGRIGGEEFGVLLIGADVATAGVVAERIRKAVDAIVFQPEGTDHRLSVSVGGATFGGLVPFAELYRAADQRLYEAKQSGRNCVSLSPVLGEHAARAA